MCLCEASTVHNCWTPYTDGSEMLSLDESQRSGMFDARSSGDDALEFNDRRAPYASQLVGDFLVEALP